MTLLTSPEAVGSEPDLAATQIYTLGQVAGAPYNHISYSLNSGIPLNMPNSRPSMIPYKMNRSAIREQRRPTPQGG